jgi:hypothetical protein
VKRTRGIGADIIVKPEGTTIMTSFGGGMPETIGDVLARQGHVAMVAPVFTESAGGLSVSIKLTTTSPVQRR